MTFRPLILAAAASAAMAAFAVPAAAEAQAGRSSVDYSDLDLSTDTGRAELAKRFDDAARSMCGVGDAEKLSGTKRHCYERSSKSLQTRVAAILDKHDEAKGG